MESILTDEYPNMLSSPAEAGLTIYGGVTKVRTKVQGYFSP